ncbi:MAG: T9SS type A sorting domain-containing protein [Ignavibacteria bacterium]|nr:T9SS type A sorting domain-containing protein [Ignavibacteria bacterium]
MKRVIQLLLLTVILIYSGNIYSQDRLNKNKIAIMDDGTHPPVINMYDTKGYQNMMFENSSAAGTVVPFIRTFVDYVTNGNSLTQLYVNGDTVIIGINYVDSVEAPSAASGTSARIYYNISYDKGVTWESADGFVLSEDRKSRFPQIDLVHTATDYTLLSTGRAYLTPLSSTVRKPGVFMDLLLGAGSPTSYVVNTVNGYDLFARKRADGIVGGLYNSTDTLYYQTFDPATGNLGTPVYVFNLPPPSTNFVCSYVTASSQIGNHTTVAYQYVNEDGPRSLRMQSSTNSGASWSTPIAVLQNNFINGDSVSPYWHEDIEYKPGTNDPYAVFATRDVFTSYVSGVDITRATKIIIVSPALNGGLPVVVADRTNVPVLMDPVEFAKIVKLQVNANALGHPSVGFSADGNSIFVTYSVAQTDTNTFGAVLGFNYNDIYVQRSIDGGLTWSTPKNITNTPLVDEMYPVVANSGNGPNDAYITYMSNSIPGSQTFNDGQTTVYTPQILDHVTPVNITNISSTVPASYSLKQNFPNPFNPSTSIRFDIKKSAIVTLKVYNTNGKEVATLINKESVTPGTQEVTFDGSALGSGIYFYTLTAGDFKETKKMMLIK